LGIKVRAEAGPVITTVDPADIRGLATTLLGDDGEGDDYLHAAQAVQGKDHGPQPPVGCWLEQFLFDAKDFRRSLASLRVRRAASRAQHRLRVGLGMADLRIRVSPGKPVCGPGPCGLTRDVTGGQSLVQPEVILSGLMKRARRDPGINIER
jgi:hypothetical protein